MKKTSLKIGTKGLNPGKGFAIHNVPLKTLTKGLKINSKMRTVSDQHAIATKSYHNVKQQKYAHQNILCTGCQMTLNSTPSHLIPRSRRPDLVDHPDNIVPHCMVCHTTWESPGRMVLYDYEQNMQVVERLDSEYYQLLLMKQDEYNKNK